MKRIVLAISISLSSMISVSAVGSTFNFLNDTPIRYFTQQDFTIMNAAGDNALNNYADGAKLTWKNPQTGHWGTFVPSDTTHTNGRLCRELTIYNAAAGRTGESTYQFCKFNNAWKIPG